ncbi:30S ribosomal protein S11 [Chlamydia trachomatis]|uniref:Small ribosomal subunit protein uS11 n=1 Tax=Chlamydia trachomatis serovar A (strain ATCC VR-571B / DSM 19440 / HAR-13) TaxID=315277 RepID=RS11_CHLTA|nr:30S ribosomal protein S11 [Chlamydia trachomatis]Q3KLI9.1 RecName: Full=Small ribosomal subunit protein uS11; AltName: Full=30S ribosomal protein S11 [Chlamydia trachomatis A/HAR-13]AAX50783.1 SSU ribosomal protein S11P [Chlamydia trachomatis A/HAR-13]AOQ15836.1 30S ribosomal protein S11 [Chlamydia trachomatis]AOQ16650.1 30S ribosomal protein S11 [Chlamydia trachomatis]AOQ17511.1 30S ribosomal protein S11 [Chlamydia trachomatis]AOQ18379.1 30S ribosomal protein S11 [Chlamydia trachomatis]
MVKNQAQKKGVKRKQVKNIPSGIVHVKATFNNTIVTITDPAGNVISWASAGKVGYSGSRKSSAFAATVAAQDAAKAAMSSGLKEVEVGLKGTGAGRESAVRALISSGLIVSVIRDETPVPHNGCRPRKRRRV